MDMSSGRITPAPGRPGHSHGEMTVPVQAVIDAIDAAATLADLKAALLDWLADNGLTPTP